MGTLHLPAMLLFQDAASVTTDIHLIMICEAVLTAIVVLLLLGMAIGGLVVYLKVTQLIKLADAKAQPLLAQATPLIAKGKEIAGHVNEIVLDLKPKIAAVTADLQPKIAAVTADLQPKIASVSSDVQHISSVVRSKVDEAGVTFTQVNETVQGYNATAQDVNAKAKEQVGRVDTLVKGQVERVNGIVGDALTTTQHVSKQIQHGIRVPVEKIASLVTAARLGIENLAEKIPFLSQKPSGKGGGRPRPGTPGGRPGPVPVPPAGSRVVHSAEDDLPVGGVGTTPSV